MMSLEQLKNRTWRTGQEATKAFKAANLPTKTADYCVSETRPGVWQVVDLPARKGADGKWDFSREAVRVMGGHEAKKETAMKAVAARSTAIRTGAVTPPKKEATPAPAKKQAAASAKKEAAPVAKPDAAAKKAAAPAKKAAGGKSGDATADELPKGFNEWLIAQATRAEGVLRTEINKKLGHERRWQNYLAELAKQNDCSFQMTKDGRFTRFTMAPQKKAAASRITTPQRKAATRRG